VFGLAALVAMLGGMLGQARTAEVAVAQPSAEQLAALHDLSVSLSQEAPPPRYAYARDTFSRISLNPDPENPIGDLIEISVHTQRLTAWHDGRVVYRFKISTARPGYHTPRGHFNVLDKARNWYSRQWSVWMPDALRFFGSYFIHSLPYKHDPSARIGARRLGRADSHGCVRVGVENQHLLWNWAHVGLPVWVH